MSVIGFYTKDGKRRPITSRKELREYATQIQFMKVSERNRLIKTVLKEEFPDVAVSSPSLGWTEINIVGEKPHHGDCGRTCSSCWKQRWAIEQRVWQILEESGLDEHIPDYTGEMGRRGKQCIVNVILKSRRSGRT